jgi:hypothetical protein
MKSLLMIYANPQTWSGFGPDDWTRAIAEQDAINREFFDTGELLGAYGLADAENARIVRVREGAAAVTDGPYLETKEHLASFWLLDVESEQRALEIAARMPFAAFRCVEVWPVMHEAGAEM